MTQNKQTVDNETLKILNKSLLKKQSPYPLKYDKTLLFAIPRNSISDQTYGYDLWRCYELSWLNKNNKPQVAIGEIIYDASSKKLVESKSLKLYLNSLNNCIFENEGEIIQLIRDDLSQILLTKVEVNFFSMTEKQILSQAEGINLDLIDQEIEVSKEVNKELIQLHSRDIVTEKLFSHLLKSNCPVTNQPDWGSIFISYQGFQINHFSLLKYIISFRFHNGFHEKCVEQIYHDIMARCQPLKLEVWANYTRRGGIEINPYRSSFADYSIKRDRLIRQ